MKFSFFIAGRYLISKKSHNIINVITGISILCIVAITCAMIIILSVFNGLRDTLVDQYNKFDPELKIEAKTGQPFKIDSLLKVQLKNTEGINYFIENIEEDALFVYDQMQYVGTIKGVNPEFIAAGGIKEAFIDGQYSPNVENDNFAIFGAGVAYYLSLRLGDYTNAVNIYVPKQGKINRLNPASTFNSESVFPSAIFSLQQEFDSKYVIIPVEKTRELLGYEPDEVSFIGIYLTEGADKEKVRSTLNNIFKENYTIKDRFEQQEVLYKIMKTEKWAVFLILSFILVIAVFNIVSSMTMLIVEKQKDISILKSLGAKNSIIKNIFMAEGFLMTFSGTFLGLGLGGLLCYLQKKFEFIKLQTEGTFIIDAYPVAMNISDFIYVFLVVMSIGMLLTLYSLLRLKKHNMLENLK